MIISKKSSLIKAFLSHPDISQLRAIFQNHIENIRFVGGCVRDGILGREIKDYDFNTNLTPQEIINILKANNIHYFDTGIKHGTISAVINSSVYEITTLRKDIDCDGRWAKVEFTDSWKEDALRRDLTINALSMDFEGHIYDYSTGLEDLENNIVRFIGNPEVRIQEDYLRIFRFFRFLAIYGKGVVDQNSLLACKKYVNNIDKLSGERIRAELERILLSIDSISILALMQNIGLFDHIGFKVKKDFSDLERTISLEKEHQLETNFLRRLFLILNDNIDNISNRLRLSKKETKKLYQLLKISDSKNYNEILYYYKNLVLDYAAITGNIEILALYQDFRKNDYKFPITSYDLMAQGIKEGQKLGKLLKTLEQEWINSSFKLKKKDLLNILPKNIK